MPPPGASLTGRGNPGSTNALLRGCVVMPPPVPRLGGLVAGGKGLGLGGGLATEVAAELFKGGGEVVMVVCAQLGCGSFQDGGWVKGCDRS